MFKHTTGEDYYIARVQDQRTGHIAVPEAVGVFGASASVGVPVVTEEVICLLSPSCPNGATTGAEVSAAFVVVKAIGAHRLNVDKTSRAGGLPHATGEKG